MIEQSTHLLNVARPSRAIYSSSAQISCHFVRLYCFGEFRLSPLHMEKL